MQKLSTKLPTDGDVIIAEPGSFQNDCGYQCMDGSNLTPSAVGTLRTSRIQYGTGSAGNALSYGSRSIAGSITASIDNCAKKGDLRGAEHWLEEFRKQEIEPSVVVYGMLINCCAKVGNLSRAEHWFNQMQDRGVLPNEYVYSSLINACSSVGNVRSACYWLERAEMGDATLDGVVYGCVINACAKVGDSERAKTTFERMRARGVPANIVIYSALARPFAYRGDWRTVESIVPLMDADGIPMNDYFLYTLLLAFSRARPREPKRAESCFRAAVSDGLRINDRIQKVLASAVGRTKCDDLLQELVWTSPVQTSYWSDQ